jgi:hypothetical protein
MPQCNHPGAVLAGLWSTISWEVSGVRLDSLAVPGLGVRVETKRAAAVAASSCRPFSVLPAYDTAERFQPGSGGRCSLQLRQPPETKPQIRGWRSPYHGEKLLALSLALKSDSPVRFISVLAPAPGRPVKVDKNEVRLRPGESKCLVRLRAGERHFQESNATRKPLLTLFVITTIVMTDETSGPANQ